MQHIQSIPMIHSHGFFIDGRNRTTSSTENGELHGWWNKNTNNEQLNRDFTCPQLTDIDQFQVTITFNVYLACRSNIDIGYQRSTSNDNQNIVVFPTTANDTSTTIIDTSDKSPSNCTNPNVTKYQHTDKFYAKPAEIIYVSYQIRHILLGSGNGNFITCYPITINNTNKYSNHSIRVPLMSPSSLPFILRNNHRSH